MDFAVFIISHERVDRVESYTTLRNAGYTGKIYVVVDNEDTQLRRYLNSFINVLVYNKQLKINSTDTLTDKESRSSAVFARNAVEFYAKHLKLDAFAVFDDDITNLRLRWEEDGSYKSRKLCSGLDDVMSWYAQYLIDSDIATLSFENCMFYVGGVDNNKIANERWTYQIHIRNTKFPVDWHSIINEDIITEISTAVRGYIWWSLPHIVYEAVAMNDKEGGNKANYDKFSEFRRAMFATVANPSSCLPGYSHGKLRIIQNKKASYPMIVSSRYKK